MAESGSPSEASEKRMTLKRKRSSSDDELENQPPQKIASTLDEQLCDQPALHVVVESSSCSSDDEGSQYGNSDQPRSVYTDIDYNPDSFLSPPSVSDLPNSVLSPLENVARGESTPHSNKRANASKPPCPTPPKRKCPLPGLSWADPADVWNSMCECDARSSKKKNPNMFDNHPNLQPRMRAILLDWLNEVCEVYKLHRETFHLTVDYVDRYLSNTEDVQKGRLQLIGITCLFIAAKVEEVYPPKIAEFAYVTDGACTTEEILLEELLILKILSWSITPITINSWLNVYMQLASEGKSAKRRLLGESGVAALRHICPDINPDESHRIQQHNVTLDMFDKVYQAILEHSSQHDVCPSTSVDTDHIYPPTPPHSDHKSPKTPTTKTPSNRHEHELRIHAD
uniref:Cyclin E splice variant 3 n=1 Tax=Bombyx mori TaxID=7091 RepID=E5Q8K2_BOMMO|nr:cyclin E splice variant 3 [Bombyx mori]